MASSNINWGAGRIAGALKHIGIRRSKATVWRIMRDNGFDLLPNGGQHKVNKSWTAFVKSHFHLMCSADFFTAEVLTLRGLVRYMVFFCGRLRNKESEGSAYKQRFLRRGYGKACNSNDGLF